MVTTRRRSARFQTKSENLDSNTMELLSQQQQQQQQQYISNIENNMQLVNNVVEEMNVIEVAQDKKKRKSSETGKKAKKKQETASAAAVNPIPIDTSILCYDEINEDLLKLIRQIYYSPKYECDDLEYRHVIVPKALHELIPVEYLDCLLSEDEWRSLGIRMSAGWEHYELHGPEPHIFLFRRPIPK